MPTTIRAMTLTGNAKDESRPGPVTKSEVTTMAKRRGPDSKRWAPLVLSKVFAAVALVAATGWSSAGVARALPDDVDRVAAGAARAVIGSAGLTQPVAASEELKGLLRVDAAQCADRVAGSWFRMIQPGGGPDGPYVQNSDSTCADQTYSPLAPGKDGGLSTAGYQPQPEPPYDAGGNGMADRIVQPQGFFGVKFAAATNEKDPQTGMAVPLPKVTHDGSGKLGGDLRAFAAAYQSQHFNQGAPKPAGPPRALPPWPRGRTTPPRRRSRSSGLARSSAAPSTSSPACGTSKEPSSRRHRPRRPRPR
jgi:hypothetical protein